MYVYTKVASFYCIVHGYCVQNVFNKNKLNRIHIVIHIHLWQQIASCSMQDASLTYPGSYKTCFFCSPVFGKKVCLIFLIIDLSSCAYLACWKYPVWHNYSCFNKFGCKSSSFLSLLLNFIEERHFGIFDIEKIPYLLF